MFQKKKKTDQTIEPTTDVQDSMQETKQDVTPEDVPKKKKKKKGEPHELTVKSFLVPMAVSLVLTGGLYFAMKSELESQTVKIPVLYANKQIEPNSFIKASKYQDYFTVKEVDQTAVPKEAIKQPSDLPNKGLYVKKEIYKNEMVTKSDIAKTDKAMEKYKNGYVKTSIATSSFTNAINGTVRRGDIISIYGKASTDNEDETYINYGDNLYVEAAYDNNGAECTKDGEIATSFTVWIEPNEVDQINHAVAVGGLQLYINGAEAE